MDSSLFADFSSLSSPLEQVFGQVPKGHDKALRQAIYNVLVTALFCILAWAVYYVVLIVLEPFLVPLFWAVLTGFVIHPYKSQLSEFLRDWISSLENKDKPAFISISGDLLRFVDWSCESIGSKIFSKWKLVLFMAIALPIYHFVTFYPLDVLTPGIISQIWHAFKFIEIVNLPLLVSSMITYGVSVIILWNENRSSIFQFIGSLTWTLFALYVINLIWPPLWMMSILGIAMYSLHKLSKYLEGDEDVGDGNGHDEVDSVVRGVKKRMKFRQAVITVLNRLNSSQYHSTDGVHVQANPSAASTPTVGQDRIERIEHPGVSALKKPYMRQVTTPGLNDTPLSTTSRHSRHLRIDKTVILKRCNSIEFGSPQESTHYIKTVFWCCICVQLFIHPSLLSLLPIPIIYTLMKKLWAKLNMTNFIKYQFSPVKDFFQKRKEAFFPGPVNFVAKELYKLERDFLKASPNFLETLVTTILIFTIIVGVILAIAFISVQMYSETLYIVHTSGKVVANAANSSIIQQMNSTLGDHQAYFRGLEDFVESGYKYGREYISSSVVSMLTNENNDNQESVIEFEKKLLELWDRVYQYWLSKNDHTSNDTNTDGILNDKIQYGPQVSQDAIASSAEEVIHKILALLNLSAFSQFTMNNMGTLISVLEQGWTLLKGNVGFAVTLISEILRILFHSGSGMVNFLLSLIVYFTALFYLLSSSNQIYRPVELISNYSVMVIGSGFANALNKAINSVFTVTFKMAAFYGLWTYLTHTVFNASIITVPVLVATFLASVPVAGQYLVALPAALELWILSERPISAMSLLLCHILPTYVVDVAIYSEVRQGIHPWITGLSIVGGVYYFGICGAIYGPLFLCGMYVILSVYTGWLQEIPIEAPIDASMLGKSKQQQHQTSLATPILKRSESVQHY